MCRDSCGRAGPVPQVTGDYRLGDVRHVIHHRDAAGPRHILDENTRRVTSFAFSNAREL